MEGGDGSVLALGRLFFIECQVAGPLIPPFGEEQATRPPPAGTHLEGKVRARQHRCSAIFLSRKQRIA